MRLPIGGYFSLELHQGQAFHSEALKLNTGRNCLEYILRCREYQKVYLPRYICEVVLEPFTKLGVSYEFYSINYQFELTDSIYLKEGEALLYVNYWGIKQEYVKTLASQYGENLIVDNTQAFFCPPIQGIDTYYTCRKFFGVADGAYLYTNKKLDHQLSKDRSYERMGFLMKRIDLSPEAGYQDFRKESAMLVNNDIKEMSNLTDALMHSIDYQDVAQRRRANFMTLHQRLNASNRLKFDFGDDMVPMIYPYLNSKSDLREHLIQQKIFVAKYWPNVSQWAKDNSVESDFVNHLIAIPIDQRYGKEEMEYIISRILQSNG